LVGGHKDNSFVRVDVKFKWIWETIELNWQTLKYRNSTFIVVLHLTVTVVSSIMSITHMLKWVCNGPITCNWALLTLSLSINGLGLWCLTPLSTIFRLYCGGQFFLVDETRVPGEIHRSVASIDKLYHIIWY